MNLAAVDELLHAPAFAPAPETAAFVPAFDACLALLRERFPRYAAFLDRSPRSGDGSALERISRLPPLFLPVLKGYQFPPPAGLTITTRLTSSGTTGRASETPLDEASWRWRVRAMRASYEALDLFPHDLDVVAFLMDPATTRMAGSLVIDAVLREIKQVRSITYVARMGANGPEFSGPDAVRALATAAARGPVLLVGYPALIAAAVQGLTQAGQARLPLPPGSGICTGGGWKSFLPGLSLDQQEFRTRVADFFGIPQRAVRDMFGLSECPAVFVQCEEGSYHVPAWAWAQAVDPETGDDVPAGATGLLQLTVPLTTSYPLLKILTTDKAAVGAGCACGRAAAYLLPRGRVTAARFETCAMKIGRAVTGKEGRT